MAVRFPEPIYPVDPVELEIHQLFDHLIVCLNQRRVALLTTYRDTRAQIAARPIARARKEEELIGLKTETEARFQMNELRETQERILAEIEQTLAEVRVPQPETRAVFRANCGHLEQVIAGVGEVVEEELPVVPRYQEMRPIVAVGKKGKAPGELWDPWGVVIDENTNLIYVAEGLGSGRVSIFSETGEFINTFTHQDMRAPCGIAIHRDNLYVTDTGVHAVFQFKIEVDMRLVAKLGGSQGSGMGQFNNPHGLTVSTNGDVFVADCFNSRIQILDDSLHFQREITLQIVLQPYDVKLTPDEVYVLCPSYIYVLTYTGNMIRSFDTQPEYDLFTPYFFYLDAEQNIIVGDWNNNNDIRILTKEGTLLHTIQHQQYSRDLGGIALTKNLKIVAVYKDATNQLIIYSS